MPQTKKKTIVEFAGGLKDLVIKVGGKIVYSGGNENKKESKQSEKLEIVQAQISMVSKFASGINKVPALQYAWKKSRFRKTTRASANLTADEVGNSGKAAAYNKIISANNRGMLNDYRPNSGNCIIPPTVSGLGNNKTVLKFDGITLKLLYSKDNVKFSYYKKFMTPVVILCPFDPKKISDTHFEVISKWYDIKEFSARECDEFFFPLDASDIEIINKYKNCIIYFAFVEEFQNVKKSRWYNGNADEFSLNGFPDTPIIIRDDKPGIRPMDGDFMKE